MFMRYKYLNVYCVTLHQNFSQSASEQQKPLKYEDYYVDFLKTSVLAISRKLHYLDPQSVLNTDRNLDVLQLLMCVGTFYLHWFLSYANFSKFWIIPLERQGRKASNNNQNQNFLYWCWFSPQTQLLLVLLPYDNSYSFCIIGVKSCTR